MGKHTETTPYICPECGVNYGPMATSQKPKRCKTCFDARKMLTCSVDGCISKIKSNGMCQKHTSRMWRNGSTDIIPMSERNLGGPRLSTRIRVCAASDCENWPGNLTDYCSDNCRYSIRQCDECGEDFRAQVFKTGNQFSSGGHRFCSLKCQTRNNNRNYKSRIMKSCKFCEITYSGVSLFCSSHCRQWNSRRSFPEMKTCEWCLDTFWPSGIKRFCSADCRKSSVRLFHQQRPSNRTYIKRMNQQDKAKHTGQFVETIERIKVWDMTNGTCYLCFDRLNPIDWHIEHIIPLSRGGLHCYLNVLPSCPPCNRDKAEKLLTEMFQS